jgi:hypothetical protein
MGWGKQMNLILRNRRIEAGEKTGRLGQGKQEELSKGSTGLGTRGVRGQG